MGIATYRRSCLAILPAFLLTATIAAGDTDTSSRRTSYQPDYPQVIVEPDAHGGAHTLPEGQVIYPYGGLAPYSTSYCDGPITYSDDSAYDGGNDCDLCDWCPCWTVRGGAVFLRRSSNRAVPIALGTPSYNSRDLGFDHEPGPYVSFIRHGIFQSCWDLEATYFGVDSFAAAATTADLDFLLTTPNIFVPGVTPGRTDYYSDLHSVELNLRRSWNDWLTLMGGFRWFNVNEIMNTDIGGVATHRIDVDNQLYGVQFGADAYLWGRGNLSLEGYGKLGVYANNSDARTTTVGIGGGVLPVIVAAEDHAAFAGELGLTSVYDLTDRWSLRGGYQLLWLDGVALAPEQLDNMDITTGAASVDFRQTAFYHGFNLAAQFVW